MIQTVGGINATALILIGLAPLLWIVHAVWFERQVSLRRAGATVLRIGALTVLTSLWWIAGLWAEGRYGLPVVRYTETYKTVASVSMAPEVLEQLRFAECPLCMHPISAHHGCQQNPPSYTLCGRPGCDCDCFDVVSMREKCDRLTRELAEARAHIEQLRDAATRGTRRAAVGGRDQLEDGRAAGRVDAEEADA